MPINASDINVSMVFNLLLANIKVLSCFYFLFLVIFSNFLAFLIVKQNIKVRLALTIPIGVPKILVN